MRILIVSPAPQGSNRGNRITAERWAQILRGLDHQVRIVTSLPVDKLDKPDLLVALHARDSQAVVDKVRERRPQIPVLVCLTGTDLHRDFNVSNRESADPDKRQAFADVDRSLERATGILLLEPRGMRRLPRQWHHKCHIIRQSAEPLATPPVLPTDIFLVSVCGHLRPIKDPFRAVQALAWLPADSRIRILQFGKALEPEMKYAARLWMQKDPRYRWIGAVSHEESVRRLAGSHLTVLSSIHEGAPSVVSEAIVNSVPILATRIDASLGLLGDSYPGLFEVGDTRGLANLLIRAERDVEFRGELRNWIQGLRPQFLKAREIERWENVLDITVSER